MSADMADLDIHNSSLHYNKIIEARQTYIKVTEAWLTYNQEHEVIPHKEKTQTAVIASTELDDWAGNIYIHRVHSFTQSKQPI